MFDTQDAIQEILKSPSTAKFPSSPSEYTIENNGPSPRHDGYTTYTIHSYVDAENGYGATVRQKFNVVLDYSPNSDTYYLQGRYKE